MADTQSNPGPQLKPALGLFALTAYAVGDILGAGIYALVGEVAAIAGAGAWLSFLFAAVVAILTGFSYAELASRNPYCAGAALYVKRAFLHPLPAFVVGMLVLASGLNSAAAISLAFAGYFSVFLDAPAPIVSLALLFIASSLSFWGIRESSAANIAMTAVEVAGLLLVIGAGLLVLRHLGADALPRLAPAAGIEALFSGVTIAFFAYLGFEDLANVAEEARNPSRDLPRAILIAISFTCVVYMAVALAALVVLSSAELAASDAPLLSVVTKAGINFPPGLFSLIALFAISNTGLLNLIMASRLAYGMAREGLLPPLLTRVHATRRTPAIAVAAVFVLAASIALTGGVAVLAQTTTLLIVLVFALVHLSLIRLKAREPKPPGIFSIPVLLPYLGMLCCFWLATLYPVAVYIRAAAAILVAIGLYAIAPARKAVTLPET